MGGDRVGEGHTPAKVPHRDDCVTCLLEMVREAMSKQMRQAAILTITTSEGKSDSDVEAR